MSQINPPQSRPPTPVYRACDITTFISAINPVTRRLYDHGLASRVVRNRRLDVYGGI